MPISSTPGVEPYQTLDKVVFLRNRWLHYAQPFEHVRRTGHGALTWVNARMPYEFIGVLPQRLRELVIGMSEALGREPPAWLTSGPGWQIDLAMPT